MATITGDNNNNLLTGTAGADTVQGLGGNDFIVGFVGADSVDGGAGSDTLMLSATSNDLNAANDAQLSNIEIIDTTASNYITLDLSKQTEGFVINAANPGGFSRNITGGQGADVITGSAGYDTIKNFVGADTVDGGDGSDTLELSGTVSSLTTATDAQLIDVEIIAATSAATFDLTTQTEGFTINGSSQADDITGSSGNDTITGGAGNDSLDGGYGSDSYYFNLGNGQDLIQENAPGVGDSDVLRFGAGIVATDISIHRLDMDLILDHRNGSDKITIQNWFANNDSANQIENIVFKNGTTWTAAYASANARVIHAPELTGNLAVLAAGSDDAAYIVSAASLLQGFSDVDGDILSVVNLTADHGTVVKNGDGSFSITSPANYNGTITLSYDVSDGILTSSATQSYQVAEINDAPTGDVTISGTPQPGQSLSVSNNLADADGLGVIRYRWLVDGQDSGIVGNAFDLGWQHVGKAISVQASYIDGNGYSEMVESSVPVAVEAPSTIGELNTDNPGEILALYFYANTNVVRFDTDNSLVKYVDGSVTWTEKQGKTYDETLNNNTLNYQGNESSKFSFSQLTKDTSNESPGNYIISDKHKLVFNGVNGEVLNASLSDTSTSKSSEKQTATKTSSSTNESSNYNNSYSYSEGGNTADKADDIKVTYSEIHITSSKKSESSTETDNYASSSSSTSDADSGNLSFVYSDGAGYNFSLKTAYKHTYTDKSSTKENYNTGDYTATGSGSENSAFTISDFSYSDAHGNSFKLTGKSSYSVKLDADLNPVDDGVTTSLINGITLKTSSVSITSGKIDLYNLELGGDLAEVLNNSIDVNTLSMDTIFSEIQSNFEYLALSGNNTITVLDKTTAHDLYGYQGDDTIIGGDGDDFIWGGVGVDKLTGGKGADGFVLDSEDYDFTASKISPDIITDFKHAEGDLIVVSAFMSEVSIYKTIAEAIADNCMDQLVYETNSGRLYYDEDGYSSDFSDYSPVAIIELTGKPALLAEDFLTF